MKKAAAILVVVAALAAGALLGAAWRGERKAARSVEVKVVPVAYAPASPEVLRLGRYLFDSRGCGECHGMDGAGKVVVDEAGMYVRSPDITSAKRGAVAGYTEADWVRAIRHGVDPAARPLLVMPSGDYNRMNDTDFAALVAYIRSLPPGKGTLGEVRLPLTVKALYGLGLVHDAAGKIDHRLPPAAPVPVAVSVEHGAYVANTCVGCHGEGFAGGRIPGAPPDWPPASNLTPGEGGVLPRYPSEEAFVAMMRSGKRPDGTAVSRVMPFESLRNFDDTDLKALHAFLKTLPPRKAGER